MADQRRTGDELEEVWESVLLLLGVFGAAWYCRYWLSLSLRRRVYSLSTLLEALQVIGGRHIESRSGVQQCRAQFVGIASTNWARWHCASQKRAKSAANRAADGRCRRREAMQLLMALHDGSGAYLHRYRAQASCFGESAGPGPIWFGSICARLLEAFWGACGFNGRPSSIGH